MWTRPWRRRPARTSRPPPRRRVEATTSEAPWPEPPGMPGPSQYGTSTPMRIERFADWAGLGIGETGWNRLVERCRIPTPFASWQFQTAWFRTFAAGPLHLLAAQDGSGEWAGVLPLYQTPTPEGPVLRLVGGTDISDYLDLIAVAGREEEVWKAMLPALSDLPWRTVDLRPIPAGSVTPELLAGLAASAGLTCRVDVEERCPVIDLADTWEGYLAKLSGKDRHELRRKIRRAEAGHPRIEVARTPEAMDALMDGFVALHRQSKVGKARFMDEPMEAFFRSVGGTLAGAGVAALWMLWLEERPAAALFCLEQAGAVSLYNSGFDPEARAMSPGVVLIARTIEDAIARGFRRYDFLRGEEPYKYGFGAVPTEVLRVVLERSRIAVLSVHTCPLAALGGKETGGMNVYVREVARALGRLGLEIDVFTRSQDPAIPEVVRLGPGARVIHV